MNDAELLALHRDIVAIPSISRAEGALVEWLERWFAGRGLGAERIGDNLVLVAGQGSRCLCFNSHLDTVPAGPGWTRPPHDVQAVDGRVYGLGSNDAKASVAAMVAAWIRTLPRVDDLGFRVMLALVVQEETGGDGAELVVRELRRQGRLPDEVVIGEPTSLEVVVSQKGLTVLELVAEGTPCHAAHARARGVTNPIRTLARDLVAIESIDLGPDDPLLGPVTLEPTVLSGGQARNSVPGQASCVIDVRTNPAPPPSELVSRLMRASGGRLRVRSDRLRPCATPTTHPLVEAALGAGPGGDAVGSRTLSDWVYFSPLPAVKVGPGATERSHRADEYVLESEIVAGAAYYEALLWRRAGSA